MQVVQPRVPATTQGYEKETRGEPEALAFKKT
jgi:hypothetical protein